MTEPYTCVMTKNTNKIQMTGFYLSLIVALSISWWSIYTMATDEFNLPMLLALGASLAFDGAALYVGSLANNYASSGASGFGAKIATYIFIVTSSWLNVMHAKMLSLGFVGMFFLGSTSVIAGILFHLHLKFQHRQALKEAGRTVDALPVLGKLTWLLYPKDSLNVIKQTLVQRIARHDNVKVKPVKAVTERLDKPTTQKQKVQIEKISDETMLFLPMTPDTSHSKLVTHLLDRGINDDKKIIQAVTNYSGRPLKINTLSQYKRRHKALTNNSGYL